MPDGRIIGSTNTLWRGDRSGVVYVGHAFWTRFEPLWKRHAARIAATGFVPFPEGDAVSVYRDMRRQLADDLERRGNIYFVDGTRSTWRFTSKGAVAHYFRMQGLSWAHLFLRLVPKVRRK